MSVDYGIPASQVVGFFLTIVVAYFSARWGGAESRKQFKFKSDTDRKLAAAELIPLLMKFANECDEKKGNLSTFISSQGHDGKDEPMRGLTLDPKIRAAAAQLGSEVSQRAIKLEVTKDRAEAYVTDAGGYIDREDLDQSILSYLALLSLKARYLVDLAAAKAGMSATHPQDEMDQLLKEAQKRSFEIDSGDENKWH
ncbi:MULTISPECIES: hypothetical protein [unclassified Afipia]|uniref:hypothetical protein n=1 Tax=unclassified Afipia TaxID=2642050 RepID=UPI0003FAAE07|nr:MULTISPECIES: hypothetical protein [unclassified Afipia]